ncbi:hypothetical protein [Bradyrhizobium jicamae]|nr:hypothetical protein [Bradyrhizobium jicamae]
MRNQTEGVAWREPALQRDPLGVLRASAVSRDELKATLSFRAQI